MAEATTGDSAGVPQPSEPPDASGEPGTEQAAPRGGARIPPRARRRGRRPVRVVSRRPRPRRARRRLRRHRHQPALRAADGVLHRPRRGQAHPGRRLRRHLAGLLVDHVIVSVKYVVIVMRADNDGEGGVMALAALARRLLADRGAARRGPSSCSASSAPRCSTATASSPRPSRVLSAVEGLEVAAPGLADLVLPDRGGHPHRCCSSPSASAPARVGALLRPGHARCGSRRSPSPGLGEVLADPGVIAGLCRPTRCRSSSRTRTSRSSRSARSCWSSPAPRRCTRTWATSAGRRSARAWFILVFPALTLNYLGQGALILRRPGRDGQPVLPAAARAGRGSPWSCWRRRPR